MIISEGFAPIVSDNARVLILGSMPGEASLLKQQYYGHSRNAFWPIMGALFGFGVEACYQQRQKMLTANGVAVWDVLQSCSRRGSLDANIEMTSIKVNNLADFFTGNESIKCVFFNGRMAENLYKKYVFPNIGQRFGYLDYQPLPSTSPAYASLNLEQKIDAWKVIKQHVIK